MIHENVMALCFIEGELLKFAEIGIFDLSCLWPWPDDLHVRTWPVFPGDTPDVQIWTFYVKAFESYRLTDRHTSIHTYKQTDRQTRPKLYITLLRGWSTKMHRWWRDR